MLSFTLVLSIFGVDTAGAFAAQDSGNKNRGFGAVLNNTTTLYLDNNSIYITDSGYYLGEFDAHGGGGNFISTPHGLYPKDSGDYLITQSNSNSIQKRIAVQSNSQNITQNITIKDLNIDGSSQPGFCAFAVEQGAKVNLTLSGQNTLISGDGYAGLQVSSNMQCVHSPKPASLTITEQNDGSSLKAIGGYGGAGIGDLNANGNIIILGGNVTATSGFMASGIGGSNSYNDAGGAGGNVVISGKNTKVTAKGWLCPDIGSGKNATNGGTLSVSGGATVTMFHDGTNAVNPIYRDCKIFIDDTETDYDGNGIPTAVWDLKNGYITIQSNGYTVPDSTRNPITRQYFGG